MKLDQLGSIETEEIEMGHAVQSGGAGPSASGKPTKTRIVVVQQHDIPEELAALDGVGSHYGDLFVATVSGASSTPPERWARATLEGAPAMGRFIAWRILCNLSLGPTSGGGYIAGWRITGRGDDWIRIEANGWYMSANIVFRVDGDKVQFASFVRYERPLGRAIWGKTSAIHRGLVPDLLLGGVLRTINGSGGHPSTA